MLILMPNGGEIKYAKAEISFEYIESHQNYKIMTGCTQFATGTCKDNKPFEVLISDNKNVVTIVHDGLVKHFHLEDIIYSILDVPVSLGAKNIN